MYTLLVEIFATFYMGGVPVPTRVLLPVNMASIATCRAAQETAERVFSRPAFEMALEQGISVAVSVKAHCGVADAA